MNSKKTYLAWNSMLYRCLNRNSDSYDRYGGRGIGVCERWMTFANFLADMGEAPAGMSLDRINNDGNYEPGNCRWATWHQQAANRRGTRLITHAGRTMPVRAWEREFGFGVGTIRTRLERGWPIDRAMQESRAPTGIRKKAHQ